MTQFRSAKGKPTVPTKDGKFIRPGDYVGHVNIRRVATVIREVILGHWQGEYHRVLIGPSVSIRNQSLTFDSES
jgi:hypothetical protein